MDFLRQALASEVEDVHAHMLHTGLAQTPKYPAPKLLQAAPRPSTSRPKPSPMTVPRGLVNGMMATQALITNTKQLINQLQEDDDPAISVTSSSSSTGPSDFAHDGGPRDVAHDGHECNSEAHLIAACPVRKAQKGKGGKGGGGYHWQDNSTTPYIAPALSPAAASPNLA